MRASIPDQVAIAARNAACHGRCQQTGQASLMTNLLFYTKPMSRGRIVRRMMAAAGLPFGPHILSYGPTMKDPAYRAINPMGKVPALVHGDTDDAG